MDSDGAKNNAEQDYKAQRWHPTMPILYNVNGHPTWVMTITDSTHAIRGYYYLDATDQSVYGTGTSPISALDSFRQALANNGSTAGNTPGLCNGNVQQSWRSYISCKRWRCYSAIIYALCTRPIPMKSMKLPPGRWVSLKSAPRMTIEAPQE